MDYSKMKKTQLIEEIEALQERIVELERAEAERKRAGEALRESEERYRTLVENADDVIFMIDSELRLVSANSLLFEHLEKDETEILGKTLFDFMPRHIAENAQSRVKEIIETKSSVSYELETVIPSGTFWINVRLSPVFDDQGNVVHFLGISRDITERKRAEEELRRRSEELAMLQATVLDITTPHDLPTLLQSIVERAAQLLDAPSSGMYLCDPGRREARCVVSYNTPSDYTGTVLKYGEGAAGTVAQTGKPLIIDDYRAWSGRAAVYEKEQPFTALLSAPMLWQGQVTGLIHVLDDVKSRHFTQSDLELLTLFANHAVIAVENTRLYEEAQKEITERKRLGREAEQRRLYLESVLTYAPDAVVTLDNQHRIQEWNEGAKRLFGYSPEEVIGRDLDELVTGSDARIIEEAASFTQQVFTGEPLLPIETVRYRKDGAPVNVILAASPIWVGEESTGLVVIYTDITERKQAEEELRESEERYRGLYESSKDGIASADMDGNLLGCNQIFADMLGYTKEEVYNLTFGGITPSKWHDLDAKLYTEQMIPKGYSDEYEKEYIRKDGIIFPVSLRGWFVEDKEGARTGTWAIVRDITERKRAEKAVSYQASLLQNVGMVSHFVIQA